MYYYYQCHTIEDSDQAVIAITRFEVSAGVRPLLACLPTLVVPSGCWAVPRAQLGVLHASLVFWLCGVAGGAAAYGGNTGDYID